jgi:hypothetical protein
MRMAGRFARRVKAWAAANGVPVIFCTAGQRKHLIAEQYLEENSVSPGVFLILAARAPASNGTTWAAPERWPTGSPRWTWRTPARGPGTH